MNDFLAAADRWLPLLLGGVLLLAGRRLFWLLVATLGFLFAFTLVQRLSPEMSQPLHWVLAIAAGLVGALLAIFAQKLAVGAGGMLFGGYATLWMLEHYDVELGNWEWVALLAGGVVAGGARAAGVRNGVGRPVVDPGRVAGGRRHPPRRPPRGDPVRRAPDRRHHGPARLRRGQATPQSDGPRRPAD